MSVTAASPVGELATALASHALAVLEVLVGQERAADVLDLLTAS